MMLAKWGLADARVHAHLGRPAEAAREAGRVLELWRQADPGFAESRLSPPVGRGRRGWHPWAALDRARARLLLARVHADLGRPAEAAREAGRVLEL